jgi:hypothetical protein
MVSKVKRFIHNKTSIRFILLIIFLFLCLNIILKLNSIFLSSFETNKVDSIKDDDFIKYFRSLLKSKNSFENSLNDFENQQLFHKIIERERYAVNCRLIAEWDEDEIKKGDQIIEKLRIKSNETYDYEVKPISLLKTENFIFNQSMCRLYRQIRRYDSHKVNESEVEMPIAFSILTYDNIEQFERLLRIIYRPHNVYCIHVDAKSDPQYIEAIQSITKCFSNVFIATKLERVVYAHFSRVQADLNCMSDLIEPNSLLLNQLKTILNLK